MRAALWPASVLFGAAVRLRAWLYSAGLRRQKRLSGVVISVGNLTVGGTGKTPFVLWLAQHLFDEGKRVGILSRGYRERLRADSVPVVPEGAQPSSRGQIVSDEVWLLGIRLGPKARIGVGADRYAHGLALEQWGIEWFVLDDGFQHLRLARDVDIVLIDATDPFGGGALLPAGRLREPKSALSRADIVVITRAERAPAVEAIVARHTNAPIFYATTFLEGIRAGTHTRAAGQPSEWLGKRAFAFCGVGNSAAFFDDLRRWGMDLAGQMAFPDHHRYTARDTGQIEAGALSCGAEILISTEKDAFNLGKLAFEKLPLYHCHVTMRVTEPEKFWRTLFELAERKRSGPPQ